MNWCDYQKLAVRTLIDEPDFQISDPQVMLTWKVLGLVGEAGELAELCKSGIPSGGSVDDELGDILWYVSAISRILCTVMDNLVQGNAEWFPDGIVQEACKIAEFIKKGIFHQHGILLDDVLNSLSRIVWYVEAICEKTDRSIENIANRNIEKLKIRYPDGYNMEDSIKRVDV